jgi:hypothetical protein
MGQVLGMSTTGVYDTESHWRLSAVLTIVCILQHIDGMLPGQSKIMQFSMLVGIVLSDADHVCGYLRTLLHTMYNASNSIEYSLFARALTHSLTHSGVERQLDRVSRSALHHSAVYPTRRRSVQGTEQQRVRRTTGTRVPQRTTPNHGQGRRRDSVPLAAATHRGTQHQPPHTLCHLLPPDQQVALCIRSVPPRVHVGRVVGVRRHSRIGVVGAWWNRAKKIPVHRAPL